MNVLVTGATAPLGIAVIRGLLARSDVSHILAVGLEPSLPVICDPRVDYRAVDLTHSRQLHDLVHGVARERGIDTVIHGAHHRDPAGGRDVRALHVKATRELVRACRDHPTIQRLVHRSFSEVYALHCTTSSVIDEESPLDFDPGSPAWLRDRVEADLDVCAHFGGTLRIAVLRCAEILEPGTGSQLWDYLQSRVCLRLLGFDPMVNVMSLADASRAFVAAAASTACGVFNIPGCDTLPLSAAIAESHRVDLPVPALAMSPLYRLRRRIAGFTFHYDLNVHKRHFGGVLDGRRAADQLGYSPSTHVQWPKPWWYLLVERLSTSRAA